jgi:hypothetical protein
VERTVGLDESSHPITFVSDCEILTEVALKPDISVVPFSVIA